MRTTGTVEALNVSPKGFYEGFLLRTGKRLRQVNLRGGESATVDARVIPGARVTAEVEEEDPRGEPEHDVFRLVRLLNIDGHAPEAPQEGPQEFTGVIERLNYALHGEVNGGILDSGDFLHLKPAGARALELRAGMKVTGHGVRKPMIGGHSVIEADDVNGIAIPRPATKKKHAAKHAGH